MSRATVGVDIGGTKVLAVRLGPAGGIEASKKAPTPADGDAVVELVKSLIDDLSEARHPRAVGVGIPCLVDRSGAARFSPHLPGLIGVPLLSRLAEPFPGAALWVGNDATAAGWAEYSLGAATGSDDVITVTLGTGIGGGIISGGRLNEGAHRFAGEFGHMVVDPHGPLCPCGKQGCWERYASGSGLGLLGREAAVGDRAALVTELAGGDPEAVRGEHVTAAAALGDEAAVEIIGRFAWWLALGLANLANLFDPEVIVLGGGLITSSSVIIEPVRTSFAELVEAGSERSIRIEPALLGESAGAVGAALIALGEGFDAR